MTGQMLPECLASGTQPFSCFVSVVEGFPIAGLVDSSDVQE